MAKSDPGASCAPHVLMYTHVLLCLMVIAVRNISKRPVDGTYVPLDSLGTSNEGH